MKRANHLISPRSMELLAQALLATCLDGKPQHCRAQEREAWAYAILSFMRRQRAARK